MGSTPPCSKGLLKDVMAIPSVEKLVQVALIVVSIQPCRERIHESVLLAGSSKQVPSDTGPNRAVRGTGNRLSRDFGSPLLGVLKL